MQTNPQRWRSVRLDASVLRSRSNRRPGPIYGGIFATLIFSVTVVSMPMVLHRQSDAIKAVLTIMKLVLTQTGVMLLWAAIITVTVALAMLPGFAGLLVIGPVIGHASWHAYRAAVVD